MSEPVLQLTTQGNWSQIYDESREAVIATSAGGHYPIPAFEVPFLFEKHILAVPCLSKSAKAHWRFAGNLIQRIQIGTGGSASPLPPVDGARVYMRLNRTALVVFKNYTSTYELLLENAPWLKDLRVTVWEYRGPQSDTTEDLIQTLKIDLLRIESKLE
ncbi:hypothetical protein [Mastigocladopsis repens]|uniref:hypothetical protein n=1 Tax=Mastigocladopsis repens TaxID=221287 RepID=UPI00031B0511|nr:hypothetical protein [Mastigocladopsis repens]